MDVAVKTSSSPEICDSWTTLAHSSFHRSPAFSHLPPFHGASRGMTSCSTPNCLKWSAKMAMNSLPRSTWMECGRPAHEDQEVVKWRRTAREAGGPWTSPTQATTWNPVASSKMLMKPKVTPRESLAYMVSKRRCLLNSYWLGSRTGRGRFLLMDSPQLSQAISPAALIASILAPWRLKIRWSVTAVGWPKFTWRSRTILRISGSIWSHSVRLSPSDLFKMGSRS